jgi:tetraacyldisaccharide 4'-kinase
MMRAPGFWWRAPDRPGLLPRLLAPLGWLYAAGTARRLRQPGYAPKVPVICVGNLTAGGAGKTPTVIALIERLWPGGARFMSSAGAMAGGSTAPVRVDDSRHRAEEVGDEPLLLSAFAPVWVAKDRAAGIRAAEGAGAQVILMDDGFQNPTVKALARPCRRGCRPRLRQRALLPAGPLREPVTTSALPAPTCFSPSATPLPRCSSTPAGAC